jgi:hypothetical protein
MRRIVLGFLVSLIPACEREDDRGVTYSVRDSAGVAIVESASPAWTESEAWRVDPVPVLDVSGQADEELFRIGSPVVPSDGRLVLFNGGACEVRFYDEAGNRPGASGRCGEGPGEYGRTPQLPFESSLSVTSRPCAC